MSSEPAGHYAAARIRAALVHFITGKLLSGALGIATLLLTVRGLPVAEYGVYASLVATQLMLLTVSSLGIEPATERFVPEIRVSHAPAALARLLLAGLCARLLTLAVLMLVLMVAGRHLLGWLRLDAWQPAFEAYYKVIFAAGLFQMLSAALEALLEQRRAQQAMMANAALRCALVGYLVAERRLDIAGVILAEGCGLALGCALAALPLVGHVREARRARGAGAARRPARAVAAHAPLCALQLPGPVPDAGLWAGHDAPVADAIRRRGRDRALRLRRGAQRHGEPLSAGRAVPAPDPADLRVPLCRQPRFRAAQRLRGADHEAEPVRAGAAARAAGRTRRRHRAAGRRRPVRGCRLAGVRRAAAARAHQPPVDIVAAREHAGVQRAADARRAAGPAGGLSRLRLLGEHGVLVGPYASATAYNAYATHYLRRLGYDYRQDYAGLARLLAAAGLAAGAALLAGSLPYAVPLAGAVYLGACYRLKPFSADEQALLARGLLGIPWKRRV